MTDICEFLHRCVSSHDDSEEWNHSPQQVLSGGDYLIFERHKQAQSSIRNGRTPLSLSASGRVCGGIPQSDRATASV